MHYANGREAKLGDPVVFRDFRGPRAGIVTKINPGSQTCNMEVAPAEAIVGSITCSEAVHFDDAMAAPSTAAAHAETPPA